MAAFDLVIRNGTVVDGRGAAPFEADIGIHGDRIVAIERRLGGGREEINARGMIVTPGFIDIHAHYDGQATWDSTLQPSSAHGVTTVLIGNCGVGFAPCRPDDRDGLIRLMEGVEDIPGVALHEGLPWSWQTFPEYLDTLERRRRDIDVAAMVPHGAVRVWVMGARGVERESATDDDIAAMRALVGQGLAAGAVGFATSRTLAHRTVDGELTPMYGAANRELDEITRALGEHRRGVFQMVSDFPDCEAEFRTLEKAAAEGRGASFLLSQADVAPDAWAMLLGRTSESRRKGFNVKAQVASRPIGALIGLETRLNPFLHRPSYRALLGLLLPERVARLRDPAVRAQILAEQARDTSPMFTYFSGAYDRFFRMSDPPDYLPPLATSARSIAQARDCTAEEVIFDWMLERDGQQLVYVPLFNYTGGRTDAMLAMLHDEGTLLGLGDGGAHVASICDASATTFLLAHWVRDRGEFSLPEAVHMLTGEPADWIGLDDRGTIATGMKADLNVIDLDRLGLRQPRIVADLPAGGQRFLQDGIGYSATLVAGQVTYRDGAATGALPGRLVRGT